MRGTVAEVPAVGEGIAVGIGGRGRKGDGRAGIHGRGRGHGDVADHRGIVGSNGAAGGEQELVLGHAVAGHVLDAARHEGHFVGGVHGQGLPGREVDHAVLEGSDVGGYVGAPAGGPHLDVDVIHRLRHEGFVDHEAQHRRDGQVGGVGFGPVETHGGGPAVEAGLVGEKVGVVAVAGGHEHVAERNGLEVVGEPVAGHAEFLHHRPGFHVHFLVVVEAAREAELILEEHVPGAEDAAGDFEGHPEVGGVADVNADHVGRAAGSVGVVAGHQHDVVAPHLEGSGILLEVAGVVVEQPDVFGITGVEDRHARLPVAGRENDQVADAPLVVAAGHAAGQVEVVGRKHLPVPGVGNGVVALVVVEREKLRVHRAARDRERHGRGPGGEGGQPGEVEEVGVGAGRHFGHGVLPPEEVAHLHPHVPVAAPAAVPDAHGSGDVGDVPDGAAGVGVALGQEDVPAVERRNAGAVGDVAHVGARSRGVGGQAASVRRLRRGFGGRRQQEEQGQEGGPCPVERRRAGGAAAVLPRGRRSRAGCVNVVVHRWVVRD
ncbi:MAG: hypothetical protein AVDCRST_MAG56-689 [uncultured Cytophagales bacterium]|uniref:Uncharacterized protein n=1 Tax=uncultured Cytophagales bacterium TaxID=158755 RepID=A0A6J4HCE0_9SPHI|nr:MAG: hypothetical protein AVDCRST_MAG56-689 [uncultured Cytophagales bacterium]